MKQATPGFTLIELMATLAVLGVMLAVGTPSLNIVRQHAQAAAAFSLLTSSLATARLTAVSRNQPVSVCPSMDGSRCRGDLTWDGGWIIYLDGARERQPASADDILQRMDAPQGIAIRSTAGRHLVRYLPSGQSSGSNVSLTLCSISKMALAGRVVVNNAGRARSERPTSEAGCPYHP